MFSIDESIKNIKEEYSNGNVDKCTNKLFFLMLGINSKCNSSKDYNHELKRILFNTNLIKNPMGCKYEKKDYELTLNILSGVLHLAKAINDSDFDTSDLVRSEIRIIDGIINDLMDMLAYTECIYLMNAVNSVRMDENEFFHQSFEKQLIALIIYHQDQVRLFRKNYLDNIKENGLTGMELSVSNIPVEYYDGLKGSYLDNNELILEGMNQIIMYLFFKNKNKLSEVFTEDLYTNPLLPYENVEFEKYLYIAFQRHLISSIEEGVRYGYYSIGQIKKTDRNIYRYVFDFEDELKNRARRLGVLRREYRIRSTSIINPANSDACTISSKYRPKLAIELLSKQLKKGQLVKLESFHPSKECFMKAFNVATIKMNIVNLLTKEYYLGVEVAGIKIKDYLNTYCYICTLSEIVFEASLQNIDEDNQETYFGEIAIVETDYLAEELARLFDYKKEYACQLIECFVFHVKNNRGEDIFAEPLVQISKTQVVFSYSLIEQVNLDRAVERLFSRYNKDVSSVGKDFEKRFLKTLSGGYSDLFKRINKKHTSNFFVNENHIEYDAYDGKQIEFDIVSTLDDYLILTELKAIMTSYDLDDLENRKENIKVAINQLHRRKESVKHDWDIFKEKVSIELPEKPYDDAHIILIACTDAFDYTPLKVGDVYITDDSSYLKYFANPFVESVIWGNGKAEVNEKKLWKSGKPSAKEFMTYLENPSSIHPLVDYLSKEFIPVPVMDEKDIEIHKADYKLIADPISESMKKLENKKKIYPNELCPCGSKKKYKYCCGRKRC